MTKNIVQNYGWTTAEPPHSHNYITPKILSILRNLKVQRVLDIGAGNGKLCSELSRSGYEIAGIEYDKQGVEIARKSYPDIPFYTYSVQDNPTELLAQEEPFDAVVSTEVIEHLFSPQLLPIYAAKVLRDKGHLVLTTPYHGYLKNLAIALLGKWDHHHTALRHGGHIKFWSRKTLTQLLTQNGFRVIDFSGVGRLPYLWMSMVQVVQKE
jgi:2-polyprenyl-3-methyl-5-hydroxy-6-metoxy-1,4-benzoquinol methylase